MKKIFILIILLNFITYANSLERANIYYKEGFYTKSISIYKKLAIDGDKEAKFHLAMMYENGQGVEQNITKSKQLYKESSQFFNKKEFFIKKNETPLSDDLSMQSFLLKKVGKVDKDTRTLIERYLSSDFGLYAYKTNYIVPFSISSKKYIKWNHNGISTDLNHDKKYESEFQISLKKPLIFNFFGLNEAIIFAYTQKVWWQIYSTSSPFRETNYEPEIFVNFPSTSAVDTISGLKYLRAGFVHESNGRSGLQSRSWNRIYLSSIWKSGNIFTNFRIWHRIKEDKKKSPLDGNGDDNPDIQRYMGYGDVTFSYIYKKQQIGLLLRNNLDFSGKNKGAFILDWSKPLPYAKDSYWYIKIFSGYGESLIDYNQNINKFSLGFTFSRGLF